MLRPLLVGGMTAQVTGGAWADPKFVSQAGPAGSSGVSAREMTVWLCLTSR